MLYYAIAVPCYDTLSLVLLPHTKALAIAFAILCFTMLDNAMIRHAVAIADAIAIGIAMICHATLC